MQKEVKAKRQQYLCQQPGRNRLQQVVPFEWSMIYKSSLDLKTILRKFLSKKALTAGFWGPISSNITLTKEEERIKEI